MPDHIAQQHSWFSSSRQQVLVAALLLALSGCGDNHSPSPLYYDADITRTQYGIPHIVAGDWGSLGYGHGFAYAEDNYCLLMREIVYANGRSAELLGPEDGDINSDLLFRYLRLSEEELLNEIESSQPEEVRALVNGFAAGVNRYFTDTGREHLAPGPNGCRNAEWTREITATELWRYYRKIPLAGSMDNSIIRRALLAASPDNAVQQKPLPVSLSRSQRAAIRRAVSSLAEPGGGSNAIAIGEEYSQSGYGLLLGNPHQPWLGSGRWYQAHLTVPGEYDVMGATLQGLPMIGIGFNRNLAWSHTVSYANRFTLFELSLNPDDPLQYWYDNAWQDIHPVSVSAYQRLEDGSLREEQHTFYEWQYGLIIDLSTVEPAVGGWPMANGRVLAFRDANAANIRGLNMWIRMGQAGSVSEFQDALAMMGNPLFHTLAAFRSGDVFYADWSAVPHVTQSQLDNCLSPFAQLIAAASNQAIIALDGSDPDCQWGRDEDSPGDSHLYGPSALPHVVRQDYVANSNNSYWLTNAEAPLTGFPSIMGAIGHEGEQQFLRTQLGHDMIRKRHLASDGYDSVPDFSLDSLQRLMYENRVYGAELMLPDLLTLCELPAMELPPEVSADTYQQSRRACEQLAQWDRKVNLESRGAQVFTEFWKALSDEFGSPFDDALAEQSIWAVKFDPEAPLSTPSGLDISSDSNRLIFLLALARAINRLDAAGVDPGAPWSQVQFIERENIRIPIHGGSGSMGVYGAITADLLEGGYSNISHGNSYIQTVSWDDSDCPLAEGILVHSQSSNPESPHYVDQSLLYSVKGWVELTLCDEDISRRQISYRHISNRDSAGTDDSSGSSE